MEFGVFGLPGNVTSFYDGIDYAAEVGFDAVEPSRGREFNGSLADMLEAAKRVKEHAAEKNIRLSCFSECVDIVTESKAAATMEALRDHAKVTAALGIPYLHHTILPGCNHLAWGNKKFDELLAIAVKNIRDIYDYAEALGVKVVYEDQGFTFNGGERFERLLNAVDRDIKVVADLGNIMFVDEDPVDFVGRFAPHIVHVHVKDYIRKSAYGNDPGKDGGWYTTRRGDYLRGTIVGHGSIDYVACCKILISAGYTGSFSLEYCGLEEGLSGRIQSMRNFRRYYAQAEAELGKGSVSAVPFT